MQTIYDEILPYGSTENCDFDAYQIEHNDLKLGLSDIKLDVSKSYNNVKRTIDRVYDKLPKLRTNHPEKRLRTARQQLLTLEKRNMNTPRNNEAVSLSDLKEISLKRFLRTYCHKDAESMLMGYSKDKLRPSHTSLSKWLSEFQEKKIKMFTNPEIPVTDYEINNYQMCIKTEPKNKLELNAPFDYSVLHNLVIHEKKTNALFSPLFRELFERFASLLSPKVYCHLRKNTEKLNEHLNNNLSVDSHYYFLEIDQEKFDKSQTDVCYEVEMYFLEMLGMDEILLNSWGTGHESSSATNFLNGIKAYFTYQRKTGDAMTCFGNTLVSMIAMCVCFDLEDAEALYFVGDDSFVFSKDKIPSMEGSENLSKTFNLKGKIIESDHGYFCSYFFVNDGYSFKALVDPLKRIERLGTKIKFNEEFSNLYERWISFSDLVKDYDDANLHDELSKCVSKRYNTNCNSVRAIEALNAIGKSYKLFCQLYTDN